MGRFVVSAYDSGVLVQRRWPEDKLVLQTFAQLSAHGRRVVVTDNSDNAAQDAVEGRARFARPNIPRPSKAIGE